MGLAEKRAIEEFKKDGFAVFVAKVKEITKFDIAIESNWDEHAVCMDGKSADFPRYFADMFTKTLVESLTKICSDDMGREALQGVLKKIVLKSDKDASYSEKGFTFAGGVLTLNMTYSGNAIEPRTKAMIAMLEKAL